MPRPALLETPPQLVALPKDDRGYVVPAEAPWFPEGPRLAGLDPFRAAALGILRSCTVCGFVLAAGQLVWRNLSQKDAASARVNGSPLEVDIGMAGHLSCMIFSAFACPYWSSPVGRLGKDSAIQPGARRGTRPAILGFENIWLLVNEDMSRPFLGNPETGATNARFGYHLMGGDHAFKDPSDLLPIYERSLADDLAMIDLSSERAYWTASIVDQNRLDQTIHAGILAIAKAPVVQLVGYNDEDFMAYEVPLT